ncbi:MAG TPA: TonB-dependent receptor [Candidatus Avacidaminococcus intestinavium]|uniref:TonB-dependent receptor n=1 Tax=Candidatus Avacidaminococcus intestinavium TaxID=2840684 RepID=A0A9D1SM17_9FIRM|nr:TonB-dependent receptor [Candidatus Avacidaminococcus intestinavium]
MKTNILNCKKQLIFLSCVGSILVQGNALAAEQEFTLDEFVVTASKVETKKIDTPANITVIDREKLDSRNYANATEALSEVPGVNIMRAGSKGASMGQDVILLNGDKRVLVLIDGHKVNVASSGNFSADWLPPVEMIEKIEVLKGAGSAIYGTDAVGGVINIITKKGSEQNGQTKLKMATGSWNTEQYNLTYGGSEKGLGIFAGVSKERRGNFSYKDNLDGNVKKMVNSGYDTTSAMLKIDKEFGNNRLTLQAEHLLAEGGSPFGYYGYDSTTTHQRLNNNIALRYDWLNSNKEKGFAQIYRTYQHAYLYGYDSNFTNAKEGLEAQQNFTLNDKNQLTVGLEYIKDSAKNKALYANGKEHVNTKSIYAENRWQFADTWQLNTGLRYDHHSKYGSEVTPRVALNKKFDDASNAYLAWGKVFNAPNMDNLYWYEKGSYILPNGDVQHFASLGDPNLKPEKGDVFTLGYNKKLSNKTTISSNVFYSKLKDAIAWKDNGAESRVVNLNSEDKKGLDFSISHELNEHFTIDASYTYLAIKEKKDNAGYAKDVKNQPNIYRLGLNYQKEKWNANLTAKAVTGLDKTMYTSNDFVTLDLGVQYKMNKAAKVFMQINNITNADYQEYGELYNKEPHKGLSRYPMPSRNFIVGMEYTF